VQPQHAVQPQQTAQLQHAKDVIDAYKAEIITLYEARKALGFGETLVYFEPKKEEKQAEAQQAKASQGEAWQDEKQAAPQEGTPREEAPWDELERHIAEESQFLSDLFGVPVKVVVRKHG
jgi:hypothetical protein